jgi:cytochrome c oxidase subunit 2
MNFFLYVNDVAENWQLTLQDPATPIMEGIVCFHNHIMFFIVLIVVFVLWLLIRCVQMFDQSKNLYSERFTHSTILEIVWTILPALILVVIAVPSFSLLYSMDEVIDPSITLKVVGHQWYWSYEYSDYAATADGSSLNYDSYMIPEDDFVDDPTKEKVTNVYRLLEVDNRAYFTAATKQNKQTTNKINKQLTK